MYWDFKVKVWPKMPNISQYVYFCSLLHFCNADMMMISQYWQWLFFCYPFYPSAFPQDRRHSLLAPLISTTWPHPPWSPLSHISAPDSESAAEINIKTWSVISVLKAYIVFVFLPGLIIWKQRHIVTKNDVIYCHVLASPRQQYWGCVLAWLMLIYWMWLVS